MLDQVIGEDWEPKIADQWRDNQAQVRMELLAEHGTRLGEDKIDNFRAMGPAPWSMAYEHTDPLLQVRSAFAHGDFYPALVGATALGERIFNHLILALRDDYVAHRATTKRVRTRTSFDDWGAAIDVLHGWGVLTDDVAETYRELEKQRHAAVHYDPNVSATARGPALTAIRDVQNIIEQVFNPHGGPPTFVAGTPGASRWRRRPTRSSSASSSRGQHS